MHLIQNNKELERKWQYQVGVLFTDQNTEETYTFPWKIFLESKYSKFVPLNSQISWTFFDRICITNVLSTIRMNVKGLQNGCPVLCENLNPESKCVPSPIQNLSQVLVHAHILTPSPLLLQSPSRPGFHLQHVKIHSWIFVSGGVWLKRTQRACYWTPATKSWGVNCGDKL